MRSRARGRRWAALALVLAASAATVACGGDDASGGAGTGELNGLVRTPPLSVGATTLPEVDAQGAQTPFSFAAAPGTVLVTYFGYTNCPDLCPTTMADVRAAKAELGEDGDRVEVAFATVDPERDTPQVLNGYLASFFDFGTHALRTEDLAELKAAEDAFLATSTVKKDATGEVEVAHTAITYVVGPDGTVLVEWPFGMSSSAMAADLAAVLDTIPDAGSAAKG